MLSQMRERTRGIIAAILGLVIAVPLVITGLYGYINGPANPPVAEVDGVEISNRALEEAYRRERQRIEQMFGGQLDPSIFKERDIRRQALDSLVDEAVLRKHIETGGMRVSDQALVDFIHSQPYFQEDGRFSRERYESALVGIGMTPAMYEQRLRSYQALDQFREGIQASALITDAELDRLLALQRQQRELAFTVIDADDFKDQVNLTDDEVKAYYEANRENYKLPEKVKLAYVELTPAAVSDKIEISEDEVKARYEEVKAEDFTEGGQRLVRHILLQLPENASEAEVAKATEQLRTWRQQVLSGQADFAALAKQHSQDPGSAQQGGDLGAIQPGMMVAEFEKAAYALQQGEISEPVRTQFGLHLVQATKVEPERVKPFEEVKEELRQEMIAERQTNQLIDLGNRLANLTYEHPDTLDNAAKTLGLEVKTTDWVTRGGAEEGIAADPKVVEAAFSDEVLRDRRNSTVIDLGEKGQAVVRVIEHQPAEVQPLEQVADAVRRQLTAEKMAAAARQMAESLSEQVKAGQSLAAAAQAKKLTVETPGYVGRNADQVPGPVLGQAFRLPKPAEGRPSAGVVELGGGDVAVVSVSGVREGELPEKAEDLRKAARQQLRNIYGVATVENLVQALRDKADVVIREERL